MNTAAQELEFEKNNFYRDRYRRTIKMLVRMLILSAALFAVLVWMVIDTKQPPYYAAVTTGEVIPLHSLSEPIITNRFLVSWAARAARRVFNLNFTTYQAQLAQVKDRFSSDGWEKLMATLKSSGLLKKVTDEKLILSAVVTGSPVILSRMIVFGRYTWRVQMKLLVKYTSASETRQEDFIVTMNVQRVPTLNASQGIQIVDFEAVPA